VPRRWTSRADTRTANAPSPQRFHSIGLEPWHEMTYPVPAAAAPRAMITSLLAVTTEAAQWAPAIAAMTAGYRRPMSSDRAASSHATCAARSAIAQRPRGCAASSGPRPLRRRHRPTRLVTWPSLRVARGSTHRWERKVLVPALRLDRSRFGALDRAQGQVDGCPLMSSCHHS
jgi:hypothetical protein